MENKELLSLAREYAASVKEKFPEFAADYSVTLVQTARDEIITGVTGIAFEDGTAVMADSAAQALRILSTHQVAATMVTVKVADGSVAEPAESCIDQLVSANANNAACQIMVSESEIKPASALTSLTADMVSDFMSGFEEAESAPAHEKKNGPVTNQFVEGLQIDENNPFFGGGADAGEVKTLDPEVTQPGMGQFPGYGGMPAGYPQQGGFQQQQFVPQQQMGMVTQSVHATSAVQQSAMVSQTLGGSNAGAYRKRLTSFLDDTDTAPADAADEIPTDLSKEEMLKNAKARKKVAKNNFNFKKGM